MAFPASKRAHTKNVDAELNLTPIMNVFVILVPFLLLTAVFAQTAILNLNLPVAGDTAEDESEESSLPKLMISITDKGFQIGSVGGFLEPINLVDGKFDYATLKEKLLEIKQQYPEQSTAAIISEPQIEYDEIIHMMDNCILTGFDDISLARGIVAASEDAEGI